ncbi:hypothetical protein MNBD_GAMMA10-1619 [hydrothermal vent metagenome]|uniref:Uncharacterized protein n=1 Tax=hydrothermal vent metagenome TaxID=652676 RepID=A0A3B0YBZ7_9ZZZZ
MITINELSSRVPDFTSKTVYLCGDISRAGGLDLKPAERAFVISELSHGYNEGNRAWWVQVSEGLHFNLLPCSTNLLAPTENFGANDRHVVDVLNQEAARIFENQAPLNHVLAQVYHNTRQLLLIRSRLRPKFRRMQTKA